MSIVIIIIFFKWFYIFLKSFCFITDIKYQSINLSKNDLRDGCFKTTKSDLLNICLHLSTKFFLINLLLSI